MGADRASRREGLGFDLACEGQLGLGHVLIVGERAGDRVGHVVPGAAEEHREPGGDGVAALPGEVHGHREQADDAPDRSSAGEHRRALAAGQ